MSHQNWIANARPSFSVFSGSFTGRRNFRVNTDDLTKLIEREAGDPDLYADLSEFGLNVEGVTEFRKAQKPIVKINKDLMDAKHRHNRLRTTLTHEYGHVHFHSYLWDLELPTVDLLRSNPDRNKIICKRDSMISAAKTDWIEWQAGYVSGAILMPASRVKQLVRVYHERHGLYGEVPSDSDHGCAMIKMIMSGFEVSEDAARVRLSVLKFFGKTAPHPTLF